MYVYIKIGKYEFSLGDDRKGEDRRSEDVPVGEELERQRMLLRGKSLLRSN